MVMSEGLKTSDSFAPQHSLSLVGELKVFALTTKPELN
jgi:hypothetical protein